MVDPVGRSFSSDIDKLKSRIDPKVLKALEKGDINELLNRLDKVTAEDVKEFLKWQFINLKRLAQDDKIRSDSAEPRPPSPADFPKPFDFGSDSSSLDKKDQGFIKNALKASKVSKSIPLKAAVAGGDEADPMTTEEQKEALRDKLSEVDSAISDILDRAAMNQFEADYKRRSEEIMAEVRRLIAMAKSGNLDVSVLILALAKVKVMQDGYIVSRLGRDAVKTNEKMNEISKQIYGEGADFNKMQLGSQEIRNLSVGLQQTMSTMQNAMNKVEGTISFADSMIKQINRAKQDIVSQISARG